MLGLAGPPIATEEVFAAALGVGVAVLLVGTSFLLRWQRNRQRFELMRLAFENGATQFPQGPPYWLVSLREAVTTLTLGLALMAVGGGSYAWGSHVPTPTPAEMKAATAEVQQQQQQQPGRRPEEPDDVPPEMRGPRRPDGPRPDPQRPAPNNQPPIPNPVFDRYHRARTMENLGLLALACGGVLTLLGVTRVGFARFERNVAGSESSS